VRATVSTISEQGASPQIDSYHLDLVSLHLVLPRLTCWLWFLVAQSDDGPEASV